MQKINFKKHFKNRKFICFLNLKISHLYIVFRLSSTNCIVFKLRFTYHILQDQYKPSLFLRTLTNKLLLQTCNQTNRTAFLLLTAEEIPPLEKKRQ